jgi:4-amino-4-deoxy-L-arabinose transferase-like glycosyltransferase
MAQPHCHQTLRKTLIVAALIICASISAYLQFRNPFEPCLNEDELAHTYNTYSVMRTGRDEHGRFPIRFLSFGENKLPVTGLIGIPAQLFFGQTETAVRLPTHVLGVLMPIFFFVVAKCLFGRQAYGLAAAFLGSSMIWIQSMARHQHEATVLAALVLFFILCVTRYSHKPSCLLALIAAILFFLQLYTYHSAKIVAPFLALWAITHVAKHDGGCRRALSLGITLLLTGLFFAATEFAQPTNRIGNLFMLTAPGFIAEIEEARRVGGSPLIYNKLIYGIIRVFENYTNYLSPSFLIELSDANARFGSSSVSLMSPVHYVLTTLGVVMMLRNRAKHGWFLVLFLLVSVAPAALVMLERSSTRSYLLTIPLVLIASYSLVHIFDILHKRINVVLAYAGIVAIVIIHSLFVFQSWKNYFTVYLNDKVTFQATQCGSLQMARYVWQNAAAYNEIYVTNRLGQVYMYLLFTGGPYEPRAYQKAQKNYTYNEYGFFEQTHLDRFRLALPKTYVNDSLVLAYEDEKKDMEKLGYRVVDVISHRGVPLFYALR